MGYLFELRSEASVLTTGPRGSSLVVVAAGWFLLIGAQMVYPVLLPEIRTEYELSLSMAGFLLTCIWLGQAIGQIPGGISSDRIGGNNVLITSAILAAISLFLVIFATSPSVLFSASFLLGISLAGYGIARFTVIYELYPEKLGVSSGFVMAASDAGQTILPPAAAVLSAYFLWEFGFAFIIPLLLLVGVRLWKIVPAERVSNSSIDNENVFPWKELKHALWKPRIIVATVVLILYGVIWAAFTGFYPTYLVETKGFSKQTAAVLFGAFFGTGILIKPLSGRAYDRFGMRKSLLALIGFPVIAFFSLPVLKDPWTVLVGTILISPLLGCGVVAQPHILHSLPNEIKGLGLAAVRTIFLSISALSPLLFGVIADSGQMDRMYIILGLLTLLAALVALLIPKNW